MPISRVTTAAAVACLFVSAAGAQEDRGEYLARIMDCGGCHTPGYLRGEPDMSRYVGGSDVGFEIPGLGIFYPPNLTNDPTGLAGWSDEEVVAAIRTGVRPDGRQLVPIMPYQSYAALTDDDAIALVRYLRRVPPVSNEVPEPVGPGQTPPLPYMTIRMP